MTSQPDMEVVGSVESAESLVDECERLSPDILLLDIDMPGKSPFEAMLEVGARFPSVRVVMYSAHVRHELIEQAIEHGAWGYVAKSDAFECLLRSIRNVARGEFSLSKTVQAAFGL